MFKQRVIGGQISQETEGGGNGGGNNGASNPQTIPHKDHFVKVTGGNNGGYNNTNTIHTDKDHERIEYRMKQLKSSFASWEKKDAEEGCLNIMPQMEAVYDLLKDLNTKYKELYELFQKVKHPGHNVQTPSTPPMREAHESQIVEAEPDAEANPNNENQC